MNLQGTRFNLWKKKQLHLTPRWIVWIFLENKSQCWVSLEHIIIQQVFCFHFGQRHQGILLVIFAIVANKRAIMLPKITVLKWKTAVIAEVRVQYFFGRGLLWFVSFLIGTQKETSPSVN